MSGYLNLYHALMVVTTLYLPTSSPSMLTIYKARLSSLSNLVLVKFLEDTVVQPRESEVDDCILSFR